jgi:hypothetical protein
VHALESLEDERELIVAIVDDHLLCCFYSQFQLDIVSLLYIIEQERTERSKRRVKRSYEAWCQDKE